MDKFFIFVGMLAVAWPLLGLILLAFFAKVHAVKGAPIHAKLIAVAINVFVYPYFLLFHGFVPAMVIEPRDPTPEQKEEIRAWFRSWCQCPECKARRGEQ